MSNTGNEKQRRRPPEFGRDGITGLVTTDRAIRAREVSRPSEDDRREAERVVDALVARATGRRKG